MPNPQKIARVEELNADIKSAGSMVLSDFTGINVEEISVLRRRCRASGVTFRVVKNSLVSRAVEGTDLEGLKEHFTGPTAVAFSDDMVASAKVVQEFFKEFGKLEVKAGYVDGQVIDQAGVKTLSDLPGREQLLGMVASSLQAPMSALARTLSATIAGLARALDQVAQKKETAA